MPGQARPRRLLARQPVQAPGRGNRPQLQLIAANVDTLFIVSSCNQDFSAARLERYLALAREAEVMPVVVLTKADLADAPEDFVPAAAKLVPGLLVEILDARSRKAWPPGAMVRAGPDGGAGRLVRRRQVDAGQHADRFRPHRDARHPRR